MGFFLNHIYSIWKLHFWRFPEMFCHQQKVVDHQSGQAKTKKSLFSWNKKSNLQFRFWISGKPQKWRFQIEDNINIQFPIAKISFQLKKWKFWKKIFEKSQNLTKIWNFHFCLITLMVHNFFLVAEHPWKTPEMEFSDRVDMVLKKSHRKILFFRKVTDFWKNGFFPDKKVRWDFFISRGHSPVLWTRVVPAMIRTRTFRIVCNPGVSILGLTLTQTASKERRVTMNEV